MNMIGGSFLRQILLLPPTLRRLRCLETFEAKYNQLKAIPECICTLRLKNLYLDSNELQDIPACVGSLWWLEVLSVTNNNIRKVFDESVRGLTSLKELQLQQNELILLPDSFGCMTSLEVSFGPHKIFVYNPTNIFPH